METFSALLALWEGHRWIPLKRPVTWGSHFFICAWTSGWKNSGVAGDSRHHDSHCDGSVMDICVTIDDTQTQIRIQVGKLWCVSTAVAASGDEVIHFHLIPWVAHIHDYWIVSNKEMFSSITHTWCECILSNHRVLFQYRLSDQNLNFHYKNKTHDGLIRTINVPGKTIFILKSGTGLTKSADWVTHCVSCRCGWFTTVIMVLLSETDVECALNLHLINILRTFHNFIDTLSLIKGIQC